MQYTQSRNSRLANTQRRAARKGSKRGNTTRKAGVAQQLLRACFRIQDGITRGNLPVLLSGT